MKKSEFGQFIKQKYPVYNNTPDEVLADMVLKKYPSYGSMVETAPIIGNQPTPMGYDVKSDIAKNPITFQGGQTPFSATTQKPDLSTFAYTDNVDTVGASGLPKDKWEAMQRDIEADLKNPSSLGKNMANIKSYYDIFKVDEVDKLDPADKKKKEDAIRLVDTLEKTYYGDLTKDETLAFGQPDMLFGRLKGTQKTIENILKPGKRGSVLERLNTYKRTLESKRAFLAKAAGDAGNLALQEQLLAGRGLPDENSTPGESIELFKSLREVFGLPETDLSKKASEKYPIDENQGAPTFSDQKTLTSQGVKTPPETPPTFNNGQPAFPSDKYSTLQESTRLAKMAITEKDPKKKQDLLAQSRYLANLASQQPEEKINPLIEKLGKTQEYLGKSNMLPIAGGIVGQYGGPIGAGVGAYAGTRGKQMLETGGFEAFLADPEKSKEALKVAGNATLWSFALTKALPALFQPLKNLGKLRSSVGIKYEKDGIKIVGDEVVKLVKENVDNAPPGFKNAFQNIYEETERRYAGKLLNPNEFASLKDIAGKMGRTLKGFEKRTAAGTAQEMLANVQRDLIRKNLPKMATIDQILSVGHEISKTVGGVARPVAKGAGFVIGAGALYALLEKLGIKLPGLPQSE